MRYPDVADGDCAIAQALGVVGDWWTLLVLRDLAGGITRFSDLADELGISRKVLAERLNALVEHEVVERRPYHDRPPRYEYHLTEKGRGLLPVLVALQDWGGRFLLGDGSLTATTTPGSTEAARVHGLVGHRVPPHRLADRRNGRTDPVAGTEWTVLYCLPGAWAPRTPGNPPGWGAIPGAPGCTLESSTFRDRLPDFAARGATVQGVSTQRPDQLDEFAAHHRIPFPLLSDQDLELATALRLPTFRAAGVDRLKRLSLVIDRARTIRSVLYPISDPAGSVSDALACIDALSRE
ncbi:winged helix-turn-helix transcriptional regulator [Actinoallomurus acaciae]|uniref:Winged helix-turn-helix transcriptional regulator n=1 Tax=Actinoallomurus acaciae TaxID=502577 RepID=A0ABV5Y885_9ACTN